MQIERNPVKEMTLTEFADEHGLVMEVHERSARWSVGAFNEACKYYAHFKRADVSDGAFLVGVTGNGPTEADAIADYGRRISEQLLVLDAMRDTRREIWVPRLKANP